MSTGVPESDPYADSGDRGWEVQPAVPGWTATGQDFYTGPVYDDTGWHIDLSDVDWAGSRQDRDGRRAGREQGAFRSPYPGDDVRDDPRAGADGHVWPAQTPSGWTDRPAGRHGRHARADDGPADGPGLRRPGSRRRAQAQQDQDQQDQDQRDQAQQARSARAQTGQTQAQPRRVVPPLRDPDRYDGYGGADYEPAAPVRPRQPRAYQAPGRPPVYEEPGYEEPGYEEPGYDPGQQQTGPGRTRVYPPDRYPPDRYPPDRYPRAPQEAPGWDQRRDVPDGPDQYGPGADDAGPGAPGGAPPQAPPGAGGGSASIVRSSGAMAVGTLGSRLTGFLRTIAQSAVLGSAGIAAAYNLSNTLPNVVYNLALGGILTSVIVPLIVAANRRESNRGDGYDQRMFTLVTLALLGITLVATALAVPIVHLYAGSSITRYPGAIHLAILFAIFFIPQIFFYGVSSLIGAILNSRGSFAAPMWTPIVNNVVVIAVLALYVVLAGLHKHPDTISSFDIQLLGLGTTLGIVAQTAALVPALRKVGFRWHPRTDFRRAEVTEIGRMAGWMFGYIAATQVAFLVTTKVAGDAGISGITDYNYAWLLFQLPYAIVGISVITALLPRMSAHASEGRFGLVRRDFSAGIRLAAAIVVPSSLILAVLGASLGAALFGHGDYGVTQARYTGAVFAVFCLGLLPYMIFQLQLRVFYSMHDSKTPAIIGLVTMTVNIVTNLMALALLPRHAVVAGLGVGFGLSNVAGLLVAWRILSGRLRGLDGYLIVRSLVRMHAAALPAALLALLVCVLTGNPYIDVIIGGGLSTGLYLVFSRALRIEEVTSLTKTVLARLGR